MYETETLTFKLSPGRPYANQSRYFSASRGLWPHLLLWGSLRCLFYGPIKRFGIGAITSGRVLGSRRRRRGSEIDLNAYRYKIIIIDHNKLVKYGAINFHFTNIFRWPQLLQYAALRWWPGLNGGCPRGDLVSVATRGAASCLIRPRGIGGNPSMIFHNCLHMYAYSVLDFVRIERAASTLLRYLTQCFAYMATTLVL